MYTCTFPISLKRETSKEIAHVIENQVIKIFGPPLELSSDNAANLAGPPMEKLQLQNHLPYFITFNREMFVTKNPSVKTMKI